MALEIFKLVTQDNKLVCRGVLHQQQYNECLIHHLHQGKIQSYVDFWQNKKEWKCFLKIRPIFNKQVWHNRLQWTGSIFRNVYFGKKREKTKLGFHFWWSLNDFKVIEIFLDRNLTLYEPEWFAISFQKNHYLEIAISSNFRFQPGSMGTHRPSPPRGMSPTPIRTQVRPQTNVKPAQVVDLTRSGPSGPTGPSTVNQAKSRYPALLVHPKPQDGKVHIH